MTRHKVLGIIIEYVQLCLCSIYNHQLNILLVLLHLCIQEKKLMPQKATSTERNAVVGKTSLFMAQSQSQTPKHDSWGILYVWIPHDTLPTDTFWFWHRIRLLTFGARSVGKEFVLLPRSLLSFPLINANCNKSFSCPSAYHCNAIYIGLTPMAYVYSTQQSIQFLLSRWQLCSISSLSITNRPLFIVLIWHGVHGPDTTGTTWPNNINTPVRSRNIATTTTDGGWYCHAIHRSKLRTLRY